MSIRMMDLLTLNADEPSSNGTKSQEVNTESKENHDESKEENDKSEQSKPVSKVDKSKKGKGKKAAQPKPYVIVPEVSHTESGFGKVFDMITGATVDISYHYIYYLFKCIY